MVDHMCSNHVRHDMIDVVRNRHYAIEIPTKINPLKQLLSAKSIIMTFCCHSYFTVAIFQAIDATAK